MSLPEFLRSATPVRNFVKAFITLAAVWLKEQANRIPFSRGQGPGGGFPPAAWCLALVLLDGCSYLRQVPFPPCPDCCPGGYDVKEPWRCAPTPTPAASSAPEPTTTPTPPPTPEVTSSPTAPPTIETPIPRATPARCPSLVRWSIGPRPHNDTTERRRDGVIRRCFVYDSTPRFGGCGSNGRPCNDEHHEICSGDGLDSGPIWRRCEDTRGPLWTVHGVSDWEVRGEWNYQIKLCSEGAGEFTVRACPRDDLQDELGEPVEVCGNGCDSRAGSFE